MTESIAEGLSVVGLVVGFPLLLLAFMLSLEQLESWGLGESDTDGQQVPDPIGDAVDEIEQRSAVEAEAETVQSAAGGAPR